MNDLGYKIGFANDKSLWPIVAFDTADDFRQALKQLLTRVNRYTPTELALLNAQLGTEEKKMSLRLRRKLQEAANTAIDHDDDFERTGYFAYLLGRAQRNHNVVYMEGSPRPFDRAHLDKAEERNSGDDSFDEALEEALDLLNGGIIAATEPCAADELVSEPELSSQRLKLHEILDNAGSRIALVPCLVFHDDVEFLEQLKLRRVIVQDEEELRIYKDYVEMLKVNNQGPWIFYVGENTTLNGRKVGQFDAKRLLDWSAVGEAVVKHCLTPGYFEDLRLACMVVHSKEDLDAFRLGNAAASTPAIARRKQSSRFSASTDECPPPASGARKRSSCSDGSQKKKQRILQDKSNHKKKTKSAEPTSKPQVDRAATTSIPKRFQIKSFPVFASVKPAFENVGYKFPVDENGNQLYRIPFASNRESTFDSEMSFRLDLLQNGIPGFPRTARDTTQVKSWVCNTHAALLLGEGDRIPSMERGLTLWAIKRKLGIVSAGSDKCKFPGANSVMDNAAFDKRVALEGLAAVARLGLSEHLISEEERIHLLYCCACEHFERNSIFV